MASNPKAQVMAKVITFILLASIAFVIGKDGFTAATVGDLHGSDKTAGIIVLLVCIIGVAVLLVKYKKNKIQKNKKMER